MVDFLRSYGWCFIFGAAIVSVASFFYYKAVVEKKGKQFLRIPFFVIIGLYFILFLFMIGSARANPAEMGGLAVIYMLVAFPFICTGLFLLVPLLKFLFRVCNITTPKRLRIFSVTLFLVSLVPSLLFIPMYSFSAQGLEARAVAKGDPLLCDKIDAHKVSRSDPDFYYVYEKGSTYAQEICKIKVVRKINDFEVCKTFKHSDTKNECLSLAATRTGDQKWCDSLEGRDQSDCQGAVKLAISMKQQYCPSGESYIMCMKRICSDLFASPRYYFKMDAQLNSCSHELEIK